MIPRVEAMSDAVIEHLSLSEHLEALRLTLIRILVILVCGVALTFLFYQPLFHLLSSPLFLLDTPDKAELVVLGPIDGIGIVLRVCFWCGLLATSPLWLFEVFRFVTPGLHRKERRLLVPFLFLSLVFLLSGMAFAYFVTLPLANEFFFHFNASLGRNLWSLANYYDYTLFLFLANGLAFEICAIFFLLVHYGVINSRWIAKRRRVVYLSIWILSALLTPPDVFTQLMLALPITCVFEGVGLYARWKAL